jgi:hypothetical protein
MGDSKREVAMMMRGAQETTQSATSMLILPTAPHLWPRDIMIVLRDEPALRLLFDDRCHQIVGTDVNVEVPTAPSCLRRLVQR